MRMRLFWPALLLIGAALALSPPPAHSQAGTTITVNTTDDELNSDGDCSLREAVVAANTNTAVDACPAGTSSAPDTILLPAGTYTLSIAGADEDSAATGDLDILDDLILLGEGAGSSIIDGDDLDRVLHILDGVTAYLGHLTVRNGSGPDNGGGIYSATESNLTLNALNITGHVAGQRGGGVFFGGSELRITGSTFSGNQALTFYGGGLAFDQGQGTVERSTFSNNLAGEASGAIDVNSGSLEVRNSTLTANEADVSGSAMFVYAGTAWLDNVTISDNHGASALEALNVLWLQNTIVANTVDGTNCGPQVFSDGYNLSDDDSCDYLDEPTDLNNVEDGLLPLADNGGPTLTYALDLASSAAIDAGTCTLGVDQRGVGRPQDVAGQPNADDGCDIGAVEVAEAAAFLSQPLLILTAPAGQTATLQLPVESGSAATGLDVELVAISPGYSVSGLPVTGLLAGDLAVQIEISCQPPQSDGRLQLQSNEPGSPLLTYTLRCEAAPDLPPPPTVLEVTTGCDSVTLTYTAQGQQASHFYGIAVFREIPGQEDEIVAVGGTPALQDGEVYEVTLELSREYPAGTPLYVLVQASPANLVTPAAGCTP